IDETVAALYGFVGNLPFSYVSEDGETVLLAVLEEGQSTADFSPLEMCGEVAGYCVDRDDPDAVDAEGKPCVEVDEETDDDGGETGGVVGAAGLPNTGGPAGVLLPLGVLMVLVGAGLVVVRRPHSA